MAGGLPISVLPFSLNNTHGGYHGQESMGSRRPVPSPLQMELANEVPADAAGRDSREGWLRAGVARRAFVIRHFPPESGTHAATLRPPSPSLQSGWVPPSLKPSARPPSSRGNERWQINLKKIFLNLQVVKTFKCLLVINTQMTWPSRVRSRWLSFHLCHRPWLLFSKPRGPSPMKGFAASLRSQHRADTWTAASHKSRLGGKKPFDSQWKYAKQPPHGKSSFSALRR